MLDHFNLQTADFRTVAVCIERTTSLISSWVLVARMPFEFLVKNKYLVDREALGFLNHVGVYAG